MLSKIMQLLLIFPGVICLFFSAYILVLYPSAFNPGTLLMLLSGILFFGFGFFYKTLKNKVSKSGIITFFFSLSFIYLIFCLVFFSLIYLYSKPTLPQNPNDSTVIVLGSRVTDGEPSLTLQYRLDKAAEYLKQYPGSNCIVSGGQGDGETETEASVMAKYLTNEHGIDPSRIYEEGQSLDTFENLSFSRPIILYNDLSESVVISTNSFHEMRSQMLAHTVGFNNVYSLPSKTPPALLLSNYFREILSMGKIVVLGQFSFLPSPFQ